MKSREMLLWFLAGALFPFSMVGALIVLLILFNDRE